MLAVKAEVLSLVSAAVLCGILQSMMPGGTGKNILRMMCGVFLLLTVLEPVTSIRFPDLSEYLSGFEDAGEAVSAMGEEMALTERQQLIKLGLEAYILDKAAGMDPMPQVDVRVDDQGRPTAIRIRGALSREDQSVLEQIITADLGIPKEEQEWISAPASGQQEHS